MNITASLLRSAMMIAPILTTSIATNYIGLIGSGCTNRSLDCCPIVTNITSDDSLLATSKNDILDRFNITLGDAATAPTNLAPYNLYQSIGPNGCVSLIIQLIAPTPSTGFPQPGDTVFLTVTVDPDFTPNNTVPLVYTILSNVADAVLVAAATPDTYTISFTVPDDYTSAVFTIAQLGYVNQATYTLADTALNFLLNTDVFINNPFSGTIADFTGIRPADFNLPNNQTTILQRLRASLRRVAKTDCIPESQLKNMAAAAFINELGCLFKCSEVCRPKPICDQSIYIEYITFITSCIKCIAYCEERKPENFEICKPTDMIYVSNSCEVVNKEIVKCCKKWTCPQIETGVYVETTAMFYDMMPCAEYSPVCVGIEDASTGETSGVCEPMIEESSVICPDEVFERSSSESEEVMKKDKKKVAKKVQTNTVVKTETSTSTYGWYAAAGVATITVAVVVYVFVL